MVLNGNKKGTLTRWKLVWKVPFFMHELIENFISMIVESMWGELTCE